MTYLGDLAGETCRNCKLRPAVFLYDGVAPWCELCACEAELAHARKAAARIPELEARIAELRAPPSDYEEKS